MFDILVFMFGWNIMLMFPLLPSVSNSKVNKSNSNIGMSHGYFSSLQRKHKLYGLPREKRIIEIGLKSSKIITLSFW